MFIQFKKNHHIRLILLSIFITLNISQEGYSQNKINYSEAPAWVTPIVFDTNIKTKPEYLQGGVEIYYADSQTSYITGTVLNYFSLAYKVTNNSAVQSSSVVSFTYQPKYQDYSIHKLEIIRDGEIINLNEQALVRFNQQEAPFGSDQFESLRQVSLFLPSVQKGDVIKYSYTLSGQHPAFKNHVLKTIPLGGFYPIHKIQSRVLVKNEIKFQTKASDGSDTVQMIQHEKFKEYIWAADNIEKAKYELYSPYYNPPFPLISLTDYKDWQEVANWGLKLFSLEKKIPQNIKDKAIELTADKPNKMSKFKAIVEFMQSKIRYVGLEISRNGYRPFPVKTIFDRKFGDCKDQTMLLLTLLKQVNIEAKAALVNSTAKWQIKDQYPSPILFDHVIVKVQLNGKTFWVDPTKQLMFDQEVKLDPASFGYALILSAKTTQLEEIVTDKNLIDIKRDYVISPTGIFPSMAMTINSDIQNAWADQFRAGRDNIGPANHDESFKSLFKAVVDVDEDIEEISPIDIIDSYKNNRLNYQQKYTIIDAWKDHKNNTRWQLQINAKTIEGQLIQMKLNEKRKLPLIVPNMTNIREKFVVYIPNIEIEDSTKTIESPYHIFTNNIEDHGGKFIFSYSYKILKKEIPANDVKQFLKETDQIKAELDYYFWLNKNKPNKDNAEDIQSSMEPIKVKIPKINLKNPNKKKN